MNRWALGIAWGSPRAPDWIRWFGICLAIPAIAMFIATAPRSER